MTSALSLTAPLRSRMPLSWLLLAAASLGCGGGNGTGTVPSPDGSGLQNLFVVPVSCIGSAAVARFNDGDRLFEIILRRPTPGHCPTRTSTRRCRRARPRSSSTPISPRCG